MVKPHNFTTRGPDRRLEDRRHVIDRAGAYCDREEAAELERQKIVGAGAGALFMFIPMALVVGQAALVGVIVEARAVYHLIARHFT